MRAVCRTAVANYTARRAFAAASSSMRRPRHTKRVRPLVAQPGGAVDVSVATDASAEDAAAARQSGAGQIGGPAASSTDADMHSVMRMLTTDSAMHQADYERFRECVVTAEDHLEHERYAEAVQVYEDAARRFAPNYYFGELYLGLGCAFVGLEQQALAGSHFRKGLEFDPDNVHLHMNLGLALSALEDNKGALAAFRRAAALADDSKEEHLALQLSLYCGELLEELGDDQAALACYEEGTRRGPEYSQLWYLAACM